MSEEQTWQKVTLVLSETHAKLVIKSLSKVFRYVQPSFRYSWDDYLWKYRIEVMTNNSITEALLDIMYGYTLGYLECVKEEG